MSFRSIGVFPWNKHFARMLSPMEGEFGHGVGYQGFIDLVEFLGGGIEQAGGGDVVDLPWDAACIVMDEGFGFGLEDLLVATRATHLKSI